MKFLGEITLQTGGQYFAIEGSRLKMRSLPAGDPAAIFLAYDVGSGNFSLQASNGQWVQLISSQSPIAWYPVLYSAGTGSYGTRFTLDFFDLAAGKVKLAWINGDGDKVALYLPTGTNPNCNCEFDTTNGWGYGVTFGATTLLPGVDDIRASGSGAGLDFSCVDQACIDLSAADFSGVDFTGARFTGAILHDTRFNGATLDDAVFTGASIDQTVYNDASFLGTDFSECDLTRALFSDPPGFSTDPERRTKLVKARIGFSTLKKDWSYLDLTGATIVGLEEQPELDGLQARYTVMPGFELSGQSLAGASFEHAEAPGLRLIGSSAPDANFDWADLSQCFAQRADFTGATFRSARLVEVLMAPATLTRADFSPDPNVSGARSTDLTGADLALAQMSEVKLVSAILLKAFMTGAVLEKADFSGAQLGGQDKSLAASLSFAYMANVRLDRANLYGVNFAGATLFGAATSVAETATMEQASFANAYIAGIDLSGAVLKGAKLDGACVVNVTLRDTDFSPTQAGSIGASLTSASLEGADFSGSNLEGADLANAAVAFANGELPVRHCDAQGAPFPPPPDSLPLRYGPTTGLDLTSMKQDTICPNGHSVKANEEEGRTLEQMLTAADPPTSWSPQGCIPTAEQLGDARRRHFGPRREESGR